MVRGATSAELSGSARQGSVTIGPSDSDALTPKGLLGRCPRLTEWLPISTPDLVAADGPWRRALC